MLRRVRAKETTAAQKVASDKACAEPQPSDAELVKAIADKERQALAILYDRYAARLLGLAQRLMQNSLDAEDLLHDLFIETWQKAHRYDSARGSVSSWLVMRLRSRALDRLRSPSYRRLVAMEGEPPAFASQTATWPVEPTSTFPLSEALHRAVAELHPDTQAILNLVYFKGMSLPEVASTMVLPIGTVKSRLHRALRSLRMAVADPQGHDP